MKHTNATGTGGSSSTIAPTAPAQRETYHSRPHPQNTTSLAPDVAGALDRLSREMLRVLEMIERGTPRFEAPITGMVG